MHLMAGTVNRHDILVIAILHLVIDIDSFIASILLQCILKLNIINEKIYTFLWFWLAVLALVSVLDFLLRLLILLVSPLRTLIIRNRMQGVSRSGLSTKLMRHCQIGDFLLLDMISKNMDPIHFSNAVDLLVRKFGEFSYIID